MSKEKQATAVIEKARELVLAGQTNAALQVMDGFLFPPQPMATPVAAEPEPEPEPAPAHPHRSSSGRFTK